MCRDTLFEKHCPTGSQVDDICPCISVVILRKVPCTLMPKLKHNYSSESTTSSPSKTLSLTQQKLDFLMFCSLSGLRSDWILYTKMSIPETAHHRETNLTKPEIFTFVNVCEADKLLRCQLNTFKAIS